MVGLIESLKSRRNNFLDTRIDKYLLRKISDIRALQEHNDWRVSYEGYTQDVKPRGSTVSPFVILQTPQELANLEKGVLDGILYNPITSRQGYIHGEIFPNGLLFRETGSITDLHLNLHNSIINRQDLSVTWHVENTSTIYDAMLNDEGSYKGNLYWPPSITDFGRRAISFPSTTSRLTIKPNYIIPIIDFVLLEK